MANFEAFHWTISSSINLLFLKSEKLGTQINFSNHGFNMESNFLHGCKRKRDFAQIFLHRVEIVHTTLV